MLLVVPVSMLAAIAGCGGSDGSHCPLEDAGGDGAEQDAGGPGAIAVHTTFTNTTCPEINPLGASPDNGGLIQLTGSISELPDGETPTFRWTASNGIFLPPNAINTMFQCIAMGSVTVTLTVTLDSCHAQQSLDLYCDVLMGN